MLGGRAKSESGLSEKRLPSRSPRTLVTLDAALERDIDANQNEGSRRRRHVPRSEEASQFIIVVRSVGSAMELSPAT